MTTMTVALDGVDDLVRRLNQIAGQLDGPGLQAMLANIGETVVSQTKERFRSETGPDGNRWRISRRAAAEGGQTLTDTARLKQSINKRLRPGSVEIGTNTTYAAVHQFGFSGTVNISSHSRVITQAFGQQLESARTVQVMAHSRRMRIVARPFLGLSPANETELLNEMNRFVEEYLEAH